MPNSLDVSDAVRELLGRVQSYVTGKFYRLDDPTAPSSLFHYSSLETVQKILAAGVIRATDILYLNDASEVSYGVERVAECLASESSIPPDIRAVFSSTAGSAVNSRLLQIVRPWAMYVFCLSAEPDLLSQWRAYGGSGGGIAIGFDRNGLWSVHLDKNKCSLPAPTLFPVIYDKDVRRDTLASVIEMVKDFSRRLPSGADLMPFWEAAAGNLAWCSLHFKNPAFFEEREWRLLWMNVPDTEVLFRAATQGLIPYTELRFNRGIVTKIVQGPLLDPVVGEGALRIFIESESYSNELIDRSIIPLRAL